MNGFFWSRFSHLMNATIFFLFNVVQMVIVSWIEVKDIRASSNAFIRLLGFAIDFHPLENLHLTFLFIIISTTLQIIILMIMIKIVFSNKNMIQIYPHVPFLEDYDEGELEKIDKTCQLVLKQAEITGITVRKIFIYRRSVPNAFSLDLLPIPFLKYPYVVLNSNVLDILTEDELCAVVVHELAHIKNGDSLIRLVLSIPRLFLNIAYFFLYLQIFTHFLDAIFVYFDPVTAIERLLFFGIVYLIVLMISKIGVEFLYAANHQSEFLADYYAAKQVGPKTVINALIRLGQRNETMQILSREIEWLVSLETKKRKVDPLFLREIHQRFPKTQINEEVAREIAPRLFLEQKLINLRRNYNVPFTDEEIKHYVDKAAPLLILKRQHYYESLPEDKQHYRPKELKSHTIDWRLFDKDGDLSLTEEEIEEMMETLIRNPNKMVFEHELFIEDAEKDKDHPSYRERIIKIYSQFYKNRYKELLKRTEAPVALSS